jgi:hypothetical protein
MRDKKEILEPIPLGTSSWPYGGVFQEGGTVIPIATVLAENADTGISLVVSPENTLLNATLDTMAPGPARSEADAAFHFKNFRLGKGRHVRLAIDLVAHEADWRGGLRWMVGRYPHYFNPPNPKVHEMSGCGCYSGAYKDVDYDRLKKMGFTIRWEASFDWPYNGMFLPPVGDHESWTSVGYYAEANNRQSHQASFKLKRASHGRQVEDRGAAARDGKSPGGELHRQSGKAAPAGPTPPGLRDGANRAGRREGLIRPVEGPPETMNAFPTRRRTMQLLTWGLLALVAL